jgi:hypothetical protein
MARELARAAEDVYTCKYGVAVPPDGDPIGSGRNPITSGKGIARERANFEFGMMDEEKNGV